MVQVGERITIHGPATLSGETWVQGSKNVAMKLFMFPLIFESKITFTNVSRIGSLNNMLELLTLFGVKSSWDNLHTLTIDARDIHPINFIPADLFFYTSGGIYFIPIITRKYGTLSIELHATRSDTGGDAIGRSFERITKQMKPCGIDAEFAGDKVIFTNSSSDGFEYENAFSSFGVSTLLLYASALSNSTSIIHNASIDGPFNALVDFLKSVGIDIVQEGSDLTVHPGSVNLDAMSYGVVADNNDFVTLASAAVVTRSKISLKHSGLDHAMVNQFLHVLDYLKVKYEVKDGLSFIDASNADFSSPLSIVAHVGDAFHTDWQPLIAPVLTQLNGESSIVDKWYSNRLQYWKELEKFGARYEYYVDSTVELDADKNPRAVKVFGPTRLAAADVDVINLRAGAGMVIAGLGADGTTTINDPEGHIVRGYEDLVGRLQSLGADISSEEM